MRDGRYAPRRTVASLLILLAVSLSGCSRSDEYPNRPITLVCPWAAGGGTDRVSRQIAVHLKHELGVPVNVINATGGKGVTGHSQGLRARPDGYTITMATLELNMLHWSGLTSLTYEDCIPLVSVNEDYAALFVRNDAPWQTLGELEEAIRAAPGELHASGTATGGAWHLAVAGWLTAIGLDATDVTWVTSTGAGPSLQELLSGGLDMVCCSLPEARVLYEKGTVRALGVMAPQRAQGFEQVPTFAEQGSEWALGGWRGLAVPLGTPPEIVETLRAALLRIVQGQTEVVVGTEMVDGELVEQRSTFPEYMEREGFDHTWRAGEAFRDFLASTDDKFGTLLTSDAMRSVNRDRFDARTFPRVLIGALTLLLVGMIVQAAQKPAASGPSDAGGEEQSEPFRPTQAGIGNFLIILLSVVMYVAFAETVGFVALSGILLFVMLCWLGTRVIPALLVVIVFVPLAYQLFANFLQVPLPRGWIGW